MLLARNIFLLTAVCCGTLLVVPRDQPERHQASDRSVNRTLGVWHRSAALHLPAARHAESRIYIY